MDSRFRHLSSLMAVFALVVVSSAPARAGDEMTLRINDAIAVPGERMAVVLRTYASRGVGRGQICLLAQNAARGPGDSPFVELEGAVVFSEQDDAVVDIFFDGPAQMAMIDFSSASGSINWLDGAMAVLFFRTDGTLTPGETFTLDLDAAETFLFDAADEDIPLDLRGGELLIRAPGAPLVLAAEGDEVAAGSVAALGVETFQLLPLGLGQLALRWDPAAAAGPPVVTMDSRHGAADYTVDLTEPGRAFVTFNSPDASLNEVPGKILSVDLPIAAGAPPSSLVSLDPDLTYLIDASGVPLQHELIADLLQVELPGLVFADGFELGDVSEWPVVAP